MKKEIAPDLYNYNKFPGPTFARVGNKVVAETIELELLEDYRDAFDQMAFTQRFSHFMLKFDYIVGDWGSDQLRLKGFYKNERVVQTDLKIQRLEDYLAEFCNFGCAYFVLGNEHPKELPIEQEDKPFNKRRSQPKRKQRSFAPKERNSKKSSVASKYSKTDQSKKQTKKKKQPSSRESKPSFVIRQK